MQAQVLDFDGSLWVRIFCDSKMMEEADLARFGSRQGSHNLAADGFLQQQQQQLGPCWHGWAQSSPPCSFSDHFPPPRKPPVGSNLALHCWFWVLRRFSQFCGRALELGTCCLALPGSDASLSSPTAQGSAPALGLLLLQMRGWQNILHLW